MKRNKEYIVFLVFSTLLLCVAGIYNCFPLVTPDSGAYIQQAFTPYVPKDRPIFYGLFLRGASLSFSLWIVIIVQSFIVAFMLDRVLRLFFKFNLKARYIIILLTTVFSGVSWFTSQVMPDIFTAVVYLASMIFLFATEKKERLIMLPLILGSIIVHNSNLVTSLLFYVLIGFVFLIQKYWTYFYKSLSLILISVAAWLLVALSNFVSVHRFVVSQSSHVFLMGKLAENGILKTFLEDNCEKNNYKLCAYKDNLPKHAWDFIWNDNGAFAKTGGWDSSKQEYDKIIKQTLTTSKYIKLHIKESIKATIEQIVLTDVGDGIWAYLDGTNPFWKVQEFYRWEIREYRNSGQNTGRLHFDFINSLYKLSLFITLITSIVVIVFSKNSTLKFLLFSGILFCILNAFTTATFANVSVRLNSRVIWILLFIAVAIIYERLFSQTKRNPPTKAPMPPTGNK